MRSKTTLKEVAAAAGLSPARVSMILNHKSIERFNRETVAKVFELAEKMDYQGKARTRFYPLQPMHTLIIVICPSLVNPFYTTIIQGIEKAARQYGFTTSVRTTYWDTDMERSLMNEAQNLHAAGVIFAMIPQQPQLAYELSQKMPVVAIGDKRSDMEIATVDMNNFTAGQLLGNYLLELGHRRLAYISTTLNEHHSSRVRRYRGLQEACKGYNGAELKVFTKEITPEYEISHVDIEYSTGYELADLCLKKAPATTAVIAINDMVAYGAYNAVINRGLRIPEDISLCGFDNIFPSGLHGVSLTSVDNALTNCGKSAFTLLQEEIKNYKQHGNFQSITHVEYKCSLKIRNSTAPPRALNK